jgi:putative hydrolase of the HAD superfamily
MEGDGTSEGRDGGVESQHLLIDGDDTLWENNVYFEQAIDAFIDFLAHSTLAAEEVRHVLDEIERTAGYGTASFARSLEATYRRLAEREVRPEDLTRVHAFAEEIRRHPMEILPGVGETLAYLAPRHDLVLVTKGETDEQRMKIEASGLERCFRHTRIVAEKDVVTYQLLLAEVGLDADRTWMIGNSPRSDINPALAAGMNAVFVPHSRTWRLELQELRPVAGRTLLTIERFTDLRQRF